MNQAEALRTLADFIERFPELKADYIADGLHVWWIDTSNQLAALILAAQSFGADLYVEKGRVLLVSWRGVDFRALVRRSLHNELDRWQLPSLTEDDR